MPGRSRKTGAGPRLAAVPAPAPRDDLHQAVQDSLEKLELRPEDAAAKALALGYARTIDESAQLAAAAAALPYDPDTAVMVARLRQRVEAHAVMAELGPKLLAALESLGASPKARAALGKRQPAARQSKLQGLRGGAAS